MRSVGFALLLLLALTPGSARPAAADARRDGAPVAGAASQEAPVLDSEEPRRPARRDRTRRRGLRIDVEMSALRIGLAGAGLGVFAWGYSLRRRGRATHLRRTRVAALVVLGAVSYSSYYYFFQLHHVGGFDVEDVFVYYIGSKYSPEIGYFGLHECTLAALIENDAVPLDQLERVRNLRTLRMMPPRQAWVRGKRCRDDAFSPERWQSFREDVTWFRARMSESEFQHLMGDHGYQPAPLWTAMARPLSSAFPVQSGGPALLARGDRLVVLLAFLAVAWAFGLEAASLVAIVWGTGFLWRYSWIGDNYLRHVWMATAIAGICLARKGHHSAAGAFLTGSTLLRIFPGAFGLGYLAQAAHRVWETRRVPQYARRFAIGAVTGFALLLGASLTVPQRGFAAYGEFIEKISRFEETSAANKVGLPVLVSQVQNAMVRGEGPGRPPSWVVVVTRGVQGLLVCALLLLFWKAGRRAEPWEGAAMGFTLVPVLTQPTNYYYTFVLAAVLLATRRPRIAIGLLSASMLWTVGGLLFYGRPGQLRGEEFATASVVAVLFCFFVLREMLLPPEDEARP